MPAQGAHRYRLMSAVQKLARRGHPLVGECAIDLLRESSRGDTGRRLQVIALEDKMAKGEVAAQAVLDLRRVDLWDRVGDEQMAAQLATLIASLPACQIADHLLVTRHTPETNAMFASAEPPPPGSAVAAVAEISPQSLEGFPAVVALAHQIAGRSDGELVEDDVDEPLIAGLPSSAFDWHCQEGRRSFAYLSKASDDVRRFFERHPNLDKTKALGTVVFQVEGNRCRLRLTSPEIERLHRHALLTYHIPWAAMTEQQFDELSWIVRDNMDRLHHARRRVVAAVDAEAAERAAKAAAEPQPHLPLTAPSTRTTDDPARSREPKSGDPP